ncbi:MAG: DsrE family protein [Flavobacteriaceae bacterium]
MKNISIIAILMLLMTTGIVQAQMVNLKKNNYLVLSKNIQQLKPVILTATKLAEQDDNEYGEFYVIFCGKTVQNISKNKEFISLTKQAKEQNLKVFVCGLSLKKFGIDPNDIPNSIEVTENGILDGFQLTKNGFITLSI